MKEGEYAMFEEMLAVADIKINGNRPWDIQIHDTAVFNRVLTDGSLGFGESYMDKMWDCDDIAEMISRVLASKIDKKLDLKKKLVLGAHIGKSKVKKFFNPQGTSLSKKNVQFHYDIGNDLYKAMLDKRMTYTCAYWDNSDNLDDAQEAKLDLICKKLDLKPGMRILDIGCGWGSFMIYAAEKYGVTCDGLTLSEEQAKLGSLLVDEKNVPVNFILKDYRLYEPYEKYDRIVSVGMLEHVGSSNYSDFFKCANKLMKDDAIFLLHTIGSFESTTTNDPWIHKYIFPNGEIPSLAQLSIAMEPAFNMEDLHNIGQSYDLTLCAWYENFHKAWTTKQIDYDERFYRMWKYYLLSCAGAFRCRDLSVWQMSLTKVGTKSPNGRRVG
ncbi:cyclopropane fatty acyl phospholipid synthase [Vibrio artabrorum]|uniref:Cyclopropane fatty acyl phospholipid synthase n=1 Tax=Vibrio artabrorum TaxID=446374 RepID=A0ABT8CI21_9VIBR|nr:cyclopropane fatty acyl phospholipid synthase [Vibrio artabrorum]MDN3700630.1 cyclopropane fatty acyl phospholipid synthase [Vibrio artabrorum]